MSPASSRASEKPDAALCEVSVRGAQRCGPRALFPCFWRPSEWWLSPQTGRPWEGGSGPRGAGGPALRFWNTGTSQTLQVRTGRRRGARGTGLVAGSLAPPSPSATFPGPWGRSPGPAAGPGGPREWPAHTRARPEGTAVEGGGRGPPPPARARGSAEGAGAVVGPSPAGAGEPVAPAPPAPSCTRPAACGV